MDDGRSGSKLTTESADHVHGPDYGGTSSNLHDECRATVQPRYIDGYGCRPLGAGSHLTAARSDELAANGQPFSAGSGQIVVAAHTAPSASTPDRARPAPR